MWMGLYALLMHRQQQVPLLGQSWCPRCMLACTDPRYNTKTLLTTWSIVRVRVSQASTPRGVHHRDLVANAIIPRTLAHPPGAFAKIARSTCGENVAAKRSTTRLAGFVRADGCPSPALSYAADISAPFRHFQSMFCVPVPSARQDSVLISKIARRSDPRAR